MYSPSELAQTAVAVIAVRRNATVPTDAPLTLLAQKFDASSPVGSPSVLGSSAFMDLAPRASDTTMTSAAAPADRYDRFATRDHAPDTEG